MPSDVNVISEAEACRWLGRRVSLVCDAPPALTGRLQHVSSRSAFILEEACNARAMGATVRLVPLALIARIIPAADEEIGR
jgi:hypothetical protein